jgi:hypothetical protein
MSPLPKRAGWRESAITLNAWCLPSSRIGRRRFVGSGSPPIQYARLLTEPDQWTLTRRRELPLHKILVGDSEGTELYVSPRLGEVVVLTTRRTRSLAWVSAISHWFYFAPLRAHDRLRVPVDGAVVLGAFRLAPTR